MTTKYAEYLAGLLAKKREATRRMIAAELEWNTQSDAVNRWCDSMGVHDKVLRTKQRKLNIDLQGAFDQLMFWRGQVLTYSAAIQAELSYWEWRAQASAGMQQLQ